MKHRVVSYFSLETVKKGTNSGKEGTSIKSDVRKNTSFDSSSRLFRLSRSCPRRDFAQKAKFRGGTLVTRAYIKESTYSSNKQSLPQQGFRPEGEISRRQCCAVILRHSFALRVISDILWSSCFSGGYGPKF